MLEECHGCPVISSFEHMGGVSGTEGRSVARRLNGPRYLFNNAYRALHVRKVSIPGDLGALFVSLHNSGDGQFVSGLRFEPMSSDSVRIGYIHPDREVRLDFAPGQSIRGWLVAPGDAGISALSAVMGNGTRTSWAGRHKDVPKRRLVSKSDLPSFLIAQFDVSTAFPSAERNSDQYDQTQRGPTLTKPRL